MFKSLSQTVERGILTWQVPLTIHQSYGLPQSEEERQERDGRLGLGRPPGGGEVVEVWR